MIFFKSINISYIIICIRLRDPVKTESASLHPQKHRSVPRRDVLDGVHEVAGGAPVVLKDATVVNDNVNVK